MRSQLRDNLRDKVSGKILDFVEAVPNLVSWLKSVRDHQRKEAERAHKARYHQILWKLLREVRILQLHEAGEQSPTTGGYAWAKGTRETAAQQGARRDQE